MVKCMNPECNNYKQELDDHIEVCPICGKETEKSETHLDGMKKAGPVVSIISIGAILLTLFLLQNFNFVAALTIGGIIMAACIVVAFMTKMKSAIITTILAVAGLVGILASYGLFG